MAKTRMSLGEYEVWIVVEDQEVEHYGIEVDEAARVATCWIASKEGQVHFQLLPVAVSLIIKY